MMGGGPADFLKHTVINIPRLFEQQLHPPPAAVAIRWRKKKKKKGWEECA